MKKDTQRILLNLNISFPLIGGNGKVSKKAAIIHIAKPVLPIRVKPERSRTKKTAAKARVIMISIEETIAPNRLV